MNVDNDGWYKPPLTIREACVRAAAWLEKQLVEEARSHAELLLMHVLRLERAALLLAWNDPFPEEKGLQWQELIRRRATGEPLQYIVGEAWFYGRPFMVTPAVLIPRPETELLVEAVLAETDRLWPAAAYEATAAHAAAGAPDGAGHADRFNATVPVVADIGTGSGAIAVTLAAQRPRWRVYASDLSPDALHVAQANAVSHGTADRVVFAQGDLLAPFLRAGGVTDDVGGGAAHVDVLVSNPPYIPAADLPGLQREVRDYEPHLALDGGEDGLDPYRRMLVQLQLLPTVPRIVAFELGIGQPRVVVQLMSELGFWDGIRIITDYNGIERHIIAVRTGDGSGSRMPVKQ